MTPEILEVEGWVAIVNWLALPAERLIPLEVIVVSEPALNESE